HALEQRDVLEGAGNALHRRHVRLHPAALLAAEDDAAFLRVVDTVDDVEHRALAGTVGADDGPDLVLAHVEGNVGQRLDAPETQRNVLQVEDDVANLSSVHAASAGPPRAGSVVSNESRASGCTVIALFRGKRVGEKVVMFRP